MNGVPGPSRLDTLQHQIDSLTPQIGELSRAQVVTWCLINYLAGGRDMFTASGDELPWDVFADPVLGEAVRRDIAAGLSARITELMATTTGPVPGVDPRPE